jgi:two-component system cell cycle sensor histidine kinase PleC
MTRARAAAVESCLPESRFGDVRAAFSAAASVIARLARACVTARPNGLAGAAAPLAAVLLFAALAALGATHLSRSRARALDAAVRELDMRAGELARRLDRAIAAAPSARLPDVLRDALARDREWRGQVLLADPDGRIVAGAPERTGGAETLSEWLGVDSPLVILGEKAGPMRIQADDRPDTFATVRTLSAIHGQLALVAPVRMMLASWRETARVTIALLAATGLILGGCTGAFWLEARRARARARFEARRRAHMDLALNRGRCGLWTWDLANGRVIWSRSMFEILGMPYQTNSLALAELQSRLHPEDKAFATVAGEAMAAPCGSVDLEFRMRAEDGHWLWLRKRAEIVEDAATNIRRLVGIAVDITDAKRQAEVSETADQRLREAIEAISEAFVVWDAGNRLVLCNSKYQRLHNLPADSVRPGVAYAELAELGKAPIVSSEVIVNPGEAAPADERAKTYQAQLADGRWLQVAERRTRDGGFVSVGTDITALKEHQEQLMRSERLLLATVAQLRQSRRSLEAQAQQLVELAQRYHEEKARAEMANRAKAEFLANMSHELRTPLNAIIGFSQIMEARTFGPIGSERYHEYCSHIHASGRYLLNVFDDVLDMSRLEAGRVRLDYAQFAVERTIRKSVLDVADTARAKRLEIQVEVDSAETLHADPGAIERILTTLLRNAVKFAPEGGVVAVGAQAFKDHIYFYVEDDGPGISEEKLARLGRPFEQGDTMMANGMKGSGLGLAIANSLVELHGGALRVTSRVGEGTVALLTIPKHAPRRATMAMAAVA